MALDEDLRVSRLHWQSSNGHQADESVLGKQRESARAKLLTLEAYLHLCFLFSTSNSSYTHAPEPMRIAAELGFRLVGLLC
jgi:hypothetical protein